MNKEEERHPLSLFRHCPVCGNTNFTEKDGKSKRCGECGFVYYFNPGAATVAVIVNDKDEILTIRRAKEPARGTRDLPGGFCDCGENAEEGVAREVLEETGLNIIHSEYLFSIPNIYMYSGMEIHTMDLFFLCGVKNEQVPHAMDDAESFEWISLGRVNADEFGLSSIRAGIQRLKTVWNKKKNLINNVQQ